MSWVQVWPVSGWSSETQPLVFLFSLLSKTLKFTPVTKKQSAWHVCNVSGQLLPHMKVRKAYSHLNKFLPPHLTFFDLGLPKLRQSQSWHLQKLDQGNEVSQPIFIPTMHFLTASSHWQHWISRFNCGCPMGLANRVHTHVPKLQFTPAPSVRGETLLPRHFSNITQYPVVPGTPSSKSIPQYHIKNCLIFY